MSVFCQGESIHKGCGDGTLNLAGKFCCFNPCNFQNRCNRYIFENGLRLGVASTVKLLYLGILYRFIGAGNFFLVFSIASSVKKICLTKLYRFSRFFSQKLCISIALIDTFLSIVAHLCSYAAVQTTHSALILLLQAAPDSTRSRSVESDYWLAISLIPHTHTSAEPDLTVQPHLFHTLTLVWNQI